MRIICLRRVEACILALFEMNVLFLKGGGKGGDGKGGCCI